jgi:hypothetical protein
MKKIGGIFILSWLLFRLAWHSISFDNSYLLDSLYFIFNDLCYVGFAILIKGTRISFLPLRVSKKIYLILLIYTLWCLIVDVLILTGIGAHDTAIYTQIDITILSIGMLWAIFV